MIVVASEAADGGDDEVFPERPGWLAGRFAVSGSLLHAC